MVRPHRPRIARRPSAGWGFGEALRLWRVVVACWAVAWCAVAPALLLVRRMVFPALAELPPEPGAVPAGDVGLILLEAARTAAVPLGIAVVSGGLVLWAWSVLWHAGVVAWRLWTGGRRVRLGEVLGLGMVAWWRYARLSLAALAAFTVVAVGIWIPLWHAIESAFSAMAEARLIWLVGIGLVTTKLLAVVVWLATLCGCWLLGLPERRSAVLAWLCGLWTAARMPVASLWSWLVWVVPALLISVVPALVGWSLVELRGGLTLIGIELLASLARWFCWVGLFCSFAPVTGVVGAPEDEPRPVRTAAGAGGGGPDPAPGGSDSMDPLDVAL